MSKEFVQRVRSDFIETLIFLSKGKISMEEASHIADKRLRCEDFYGDSPLGHKGPYFLANMIAKEMGYTKYPSC